ncbi:MAG TPA: PQQ-binding-like beta-propeller repeat protein [Candidatus Kryptonia bacterium]|nr:PQQ-binding-like beta-propeller repeat protein [Candidatus Kryptonia bacterium]
MSPRHRCLALMLLSLVAACSSGSNAVCNNGTGLAPADGVWPQSRHDGYNTGRTDVQVTGTTPTLKWTQANTAVSQRAFVSGAIISTDGAHLYIGSLDGLVYSLDTATGEHDDAFEANFLGAFPDPSGAPILGGPALDSGGNVYVSTNATLLVLTPQGMLLRSAAIGGPGTAPALATNVNGIIGLNGTAYVGAQTGASTGFFVAVCANSIDRWSFISDPRTLAGDPVTSAAAVGTDGTVYFASASSLRPFLRAIDPIFAILKWTFGASAPIVASPVLDTDAKTIYVATISGGASSIAHVYSVDPATGSRKPFTFALPEPGFDISASPALGFPASDGTGVGTIYVAATDGRLYAVDINNPTQPRVFETEGAAMSPPLGIQSSPLVAHDGDNATIIFGSDDGHVYRVVDDGTTLTEAWQFEVPSEDGKPVSIGTASAAIGEDGTVYIGTGDGHVYAIAGTS